MLRTQLDESLAFTALLEMDPTFRNLTSEAGQRRINALLLAWYAQEEVKNMWAFARKWLDDEADFKERVDRAHDARDEP